MIKSLTAGLVGSMAMTAVAAANSSISGWQLNWGNAWTVRGEFSKGRDMSAVAAFSPEHGLMASDETRGAQRISFDAAARVLTVHEMLPLVPGKGAELDLEAATASAEERAYYLIGSQALSRKKEAFEADRGFVFKLPVDAEHRPQLGAVTKADFRALLQADKSLAPFLNQPAEANGLDIEGLAERKGRLFFGLRAPVLDGQATLLEVGTTELFGGKATLTHHRLAVGRGRGVRDLTTLSGDTGFLVLVGPSGGPDSAHARDGAAYELWHWPGPGSAATRIGALGAVLNDPEAKAEAILVLSQSPTAIEGLVIHDGPKNGAPHGFRLTPPPAP